MRVRDWLLSSGVAASVLYAITDLLGGLRYPGYSFNSQAVSELMAIGAPSERIVDPLFLLYNVLMLVLAIAVYKEGLTLTAVLIAIYAALGFTGPTLFEMHQRGTPGANDLPHIVLTAIMVLLMLAFMITGATAMKPWFRIYTAATIATLMLFGTITSVMAAGIAANVPTPGMGVAERITIYASQAWIAAFAMTLRLSRSSWSFPATADEFALATSSRAGR